VFNMIEDLFAPGRKHSEDERKRLELTRVDLNDGDPGRGPIDLTSGKVVVRLQTHPAGERDDDHADPAEPDGATAPAAPHDPADLGDSADPDDAADPTDPGDPADPHDPADPGDATDPADPSDPDDPEARA
jgi:hypothetical protein